MADCKWEKDGGCKLGVKGKALPAVAKSIYCDKHRLKKQEEDKLKVAKEKREKEDKDREAVKLQMAKDAKAKQEAEALRTKKIGELKTQWNQSVQAIVQQVKGFRARNPTVQGINAGTNASGIGNTAGGSNNPLELKLPSDAKGIIKSDVFKLMSGFDGSDSSDIKIRTVDPNGNILVHIK